MLTFFKCLLTHFVNVFFWMASLSSRTTVGLEKILSYWLLVEIPEKFKLISPKGLTSTNYRCKLSLSGSSSSHTRHQTQQIMNIGIFYGNIFLQVLTNCELLLNAEYSTR